MFACLFLTRFNEFVVTVIKDMILPNLVWRAGRVAAAIRTTAVSCLWAVVQSDVMTRDKVGSFVLFSLKFLFLEMFFIFQI